MKKMLIFIIILYVNLISCNNRNNEILKEDILLNIWIEDYYSKLQKISNFIIERRKESEIDLSWDKTFDIKKIKEDFKGYKVKLKTNTFSRIDFDSLYINYLEGITSHDLKEKLKMTLCDKKNETGDKLSTMNLLEFRVLTKLLELFSINHFQSKFVRPIVVPQRNVISLGDEYKCEILLAAWNEYDYIAIVDGQTLTNYNQTPIYIAKPSQKGKVKVKGKLGIRVNYNIPDTIYYPFEISYEVK
jgi:hypothetical protein